MFNKDFGERYEQFLKIIVIFIFGNFFHYGEKIKLENFEIFF
jgi:hypothetical protein